MAFPKTQLFPATGDGCCTDGEQCDETCIAIVAAEVCESAAHTDDIHKYSCHDVDNNVDAKTLDEENKRCVDEATRKCEKNCNEVREPATPSVNDCCSKEIQADGQRDTALASCENDHRAGRADHQRCWMGLSTCTSSETGSIDGKEIHDFREACPSHLEEAIKKYTAYLDAGICICSNALRRVNNNCCDHEKRAAFLRKRRATSNASKTWGAKLGTPMKRCRLSDSQQDGDAACKFANGSSFYPGEVITGIQSKESLPGKGKADVNHECCAEERRTKEPATKTTSSENVHRIHDADDIEIAAAREHVTFSITGMTCTGCVKKVTGILDHVEGVENIKMNFVAGLGDIDVDKSKNSASAVLRQIERESGFRCSRITSDFQSLDVVLSPAAVHLFSCNMPKGVDSIEQVRKIHRITFDPMVIGPREILSRTRGSLAPPSNDDAVNDGRRRFKFKLWSFIASTVLTIPVVVLAWSGAPVSFMSKSIVSLVLGTLVQIIAVPEFYIPALKALIYSRSVEMDMLVVISVTAAYAYSVVAFTLERAGLDLEQGEFFETSTLLITLVLLGRLVSAYAKVRAVQSVSLKSLQAETAYLETADGETTELDARLLQFNDVIRIASHAKIVSDGEVVDGTSSVDESMLTGESQPVPKSFGDTVIAGTVNGPGVMSIRLTRLPGQNSITDISYSVQNALSSKPRIQDLADVVAGYFVPVVFTISVIVFATWIGVAVKSWNQNAGGAIGTAITYAIAVLAVSCPCALGLAVPLVLVVAGGVAARGGVIIKQADATERGFRVTDVIFDKTGTLTTGRLQVVQQKIHDSSISATEALALTYALVKDNDHPVARAVAVSLKAQHPEAVRVKAVKSVPGAGVKAIWNGRSVAAGNAYWLGIDTDPAVAALQTEGLTLLCVTLRDQPVVSIGLKAEIRPEAYAVVNLLQTRGIDCHVVSGDQPTAVRDAAAKLNIASEHTASRQSPADKQAYIQNLMATGKTTLFVGDGTNDAVAIAQANVGAQIGSASDISRAAADVVLLGGLDGIVTLLNISKQSFYRIFFNFIWAFLYNLFAILLASGAFVKVRIPPSFAGLGEIVSVLPLIFAAVTLLQVKVGIE